MDLTKSSDRPLALMTNASSGIGYELAKEFAKHGYDLVIISKNAAIVETAQICRYLGVNVETLILDLNRNDDLEQIMLRISKHDLPISALAINPEESEQNSSLASCMPLIKLVMKNMVYHKKGRILISSSLVDNISELTGLREFIDTDDTEISITIIADTEVDGLKSGNAALYAQRAFAEIQVETTQPIEFEPEESKSEAPQKSTEPARLKH